MVKAYSPHEHKPLLGYAALTAVFNGLAAAYVVQHKRSGHRWPARFPAADFALMAGATYKLSRLISKDKVTSVLRSPFTRFKEEAGPSEVEEEARGTGLQLAIGELLVCPYCVGQWVAAAFVGGYARDPDATRTAAAVFALLGASDFLQQAWSAVDKRA